MDHKFHKNIEVYWFVTLLLLQAVVVLLFVRFLQDSIYLFVIVSSLFLTLLFFKFRDIFVRPLQQINDDIEDFRQGKTDKIWEHGEHHLFRKLSRFFDATMEVLTSVRDEYIAGKVLSEDVSHASELQRFMIGKKHKIIWWLDIVWCTRAAEEINGDSFDFFQKGDQCYIYVGDATWHGVTSWLIGSMANTLLEAYGEHLVEWDRVVIEANKLLFSRLHDARIMTLALLRWDTSISRLYLTWAGHERLLIWRASTGEVDVYRSWGIALGMKKDISKHTYETAIPFHESDVFVLYSDGITEARTMADGVRQSYGLDRLKDMIKRAPKKKPAVIFSHITQDLSNFLWHSYVQRDDVTLVCWGVSHGHGSSTFPKIAYQSGHWRWDKRKEKQGE